MKKLFSIIALSSLVAAGAVFNNSTSKSVGEIKAAAYQSAVPLGTIYDSIAGTTESKSLTADYDYDCGTYATMRVNKGAATNIPYIRNHSKNGYLLGLKYSNTHNLGELGAYAQFDAKDGYLLSGVSWPQFHQTSGFGYDIRVFDSDLSSYVSVQSEYITKQTAVNCDFGAPTSSFRIYHLHQDPSITRQELVLQGGITLDIDYDKQSHMLSFNTNGGSQIESIKVYEGEVTVPPTDPIKPNSGSTKYTFAGWYTDQSCTDGNEFSFGGYLTQDTIIYAKWNEQTVTGHTLTFVTNSSSVIPPQVAEIGSPYTEPLTNPTKDSDAKYNYSFDKWYSDEGLTTEFDFTVVYDADMTAYAGYSYSQSTLAGAVSVGMKSKIGAQGKSGYGDGWSYEAYEEHTVQSSEVNSEMVDSTFEFKSAYYNNYGLKRTWDNTKSYYKYDVRMKRCHVVWSLNDYSKYIRTVRWDIKNTGHEAYSSSYVVRLYANASGTGAEVDSDHLSLKSSDADRCIQMTNNTDETVRAVSFKQDNVSFDYGFEKLHYILGDASAAQQTKNFASDFLDEMTCSGTGSITAVEGTWAKISTRAAKLSSDAKEILSGSSSSDQNVQAALERYDAIIRKYGTDQYADFLNRFGGSHSSSLTLGNIFEANELPVIIVVVGLLVVAIPSVFLYIKRRKENI